MGLDGVLFGLEILGPDNAVDQLIAVPFITLDEGATILHGSGVFHTFHGFRVLIRLVLGRAGIEIHNKMRPIVMSGALRVQIDFFHFYVNL